MLIGKWKYRLLMFLYYVLCLWGLVWQIGQFLFQFFEYAVAKDINVIMPWDMKTTNRFTYVCIPNHQIFDEKKYSELFEKKSLMDRQYSRYGGKIRSDDAKRFLSKNSTIYERLSLTPNKSKIFEELSDCREFIIGLEYCYQYDWTAEPYIKNEWRKNIKSISISRDYDVPLNYKYGLLFFNHKRMVTHTIKSEIEVNLKVSSYAYLMQKLELPYSDACVKYGSLGIGYWNQEEAITNCFKKKNHRNLDISANRIVRRDEERYSNYSIDYASEYTYEETLCRERYSYPDCTDLVHFTQASLTEMYNVSSPSIQFESYKDTEPSLIIRSKAQIDDLEFITYMFGAFGTWLGFSWIAVNPITFLFRTNDTAGDNNSEFSSFKRKTEITLVCHNKEIVSVKKALTDLHQLNSDSMNEMIQLVSDFMKEMMEQNSNLRNEIVELINNN